ncbi:hypothetical protein ANABIO32_29110 [Rossellomorea marisflavi]|uniref:hypothetical protein n=1 Tax=Rossellomorea marisflavi TaxID=189381 RepID=UPI0025CAAAFD|nr:hypothetical protein [Rossellomorea marisflavi]GLI85187.1 hypothetical protein ANABIO32_29110 [Rossellomorea marisflavi]
MNFGENLQNWFSTEMGAVFTVIIGAIAIYFLVRREFSKFIGFGVFAMITGVFIFQPDSVVSLGSKLWTTVFGG